METDVPEFFGVYVKLSDGTLVELRPTPSYTYRSYKTVQTVDPETGATIVEPLSTGDRFYYVSGRPDSAVRLGEIEGFYVFGDYNVQGFSLDVYSPAAVAENEVVVTGTDTGPGILVPGNFARTGHALTLESDFRYIEREPKLYWITPRLPIQIGLPEQDLLVISLAHHDQLWSFSIRKERYLELLDVTAASLRAGEYEEGLEAAEESLELHPTAQADWYIIRHNFKLNAIDDALDAAGAAAERWPDNTDIMVLTGEIHNAMGRYDKAVPYFKTAVDKRTADAYAYSGLAYAYLKMGASPEDAITMAERGLRLAQYADQRAALLATLAEAYAEQGDHNKALKNSKRAERTAPNNLRAVQVRACAEFNAELVPPKKKKKKKVWEEQMAAAPAPSRIRTPLIATWEGSLVRDGQKIQTQVEVTPVGNDGVQAKCRFKTPEVNEWGTYRMAGQINPVTQRVHLAGVEKLGDYPVPYEMADLYATVSPDFASVSWSAPVGQPNLKKR